ncbi:MAG: M20 family peptidase [Spirochaetales bacterium]|nr:M20 family peptidase [Spirochaetales bacterium]
MMKKIFIFIGTILGIFAVIILAALINTATVKSTQVESAVESSEIATKAIEGLDRDKIALNLATMISFPTISWYDSDKFDKKAFGELELFLEKNYENAAKVLKKEKINEMSILYKWEGSNPEKKPIMLLSHQDVVPVEVGTEDDWTYPAFGKNVKDGYIWGRGAIDMKNHLCSIMDAVDALAKSGFVPEATIYLGFGHDEEVGGHAGNESIARILKERGVQIAVVLDEGGAVIPDALPGFDKPIAVVGIAEKGYVTLEITASSEGGHSSQPPSSSAAGKLAKAVAAIEKNQFPASLDGPAIETFDYLAGDMSFGYKFLFSNKWLFSSLIKKALLSSPQTAAMIRTTTAVTVLKSGEKDNTLPQKATALINFRILSGESVEDVISHTKKVAGDDIEVKIYNISFEPTPVSDPASADFEMFRKTISAVYPDSLSAPYLVIGGTDARYYRDVADSVYRFSPIILTTEDLLLVHNTDERISVENLYKQTEFMIRFIDAFAGR